MESAPCQCSHSSGRSYGAYGDKSLFWSPLMSILSPTAPATASGKASQIKYGPGGYVYEQFLNGNLRITHTPRGPADIYIKADPNDARWLAITREIGPSPGWQAWFGTHPPPAKGSSSTRKASSAAASDSAYRAAAANSGYSADRAGKRLAFLQTLSQAVQGIAGGGTAAPGEAEVASASAATATAPLAESEETPMSTYLLWGGVGVAALVVLGLALSGGGRQRAAAPAQ